MKFAYTIICVADVPATVEFYEKAFDLKTRFVHESKLYAEMETGETTLINALKKTKGKTVCQDYPLFQ